ncbi:ribonuclease H-like domain-containing protein [Mycena pura]|uniref:Ribonuclease H-like domain-containing protein n=1 Tax=Mycena pura TaxID=153505 RepID=A0AAD6Y358_9AGAR|nr:ribonuclease H-like domain-containing protein [Mycena pura]
MPPKLGPCWEFFYPGPKQNQHHRTAYCLGCIRRHRQGLDPPNDTDIALKQRLQWDEAAFTQDRAKSVAQRERKGKGRQAPQSSSESDADDESDSHRPKKKRKKVFLAVAKAMEQPQLQVYRGANIPFSPAELERLREQFARATISANLPFQWTEDIEIIKLFIMFRSTAADVIPARDVLSGTLLNQLYDTVEKKLRAHLKGKRCAFMTDGWKDDSRNPITGANVATSTDSYLVDVFQSNGHKKDGESMCTAFGNMIDKTENTYGCFIVLFVCDNDGGAQRGRKNLAIKRPWLLIAPCCAHQGQLMLGDYLVVNVDAAKIAEQAIEIVHWILSHDRVRKIFDDAQFEKNFKVLVYLVANLTRWTTHYIAFRRLLELRGALRHAVYLRRDDLITAQLGAEKNKKARAKITAQVNTQCDLIEDNSFWSSLEGVVNDIEPLCYATNINQADRTRPDQVLLSFAGLFRHFATHPNRTVAKGMLMRIEKRWAALDQQMFVLCLVLNPYEGLGRFGEKSEINVFVLSMELVALFHRVRTRPRPQARLVQDDARREREISSAFLQYMRGSGPFKPWQENKVQFQAQHPDEPHLVWESFKDTEGVKELARFAILLLGLVVNQASTERTFSDLKIKKTRLRNRLGTEKLGKMSKVGASIRQENLAAGLIHARAARDVHDPTKVARLLTVPQYADALDPDCDEDGNSASNLVKTAASWRAEVSQWVKAAEEEEDESDKEAGTKPGEEEESESGSDAPAEVDPKVVANPVGKPRQKQFTREALMMELLAAAESDEELDDGALSGSGDDYEVLTTALVQAILFFAPLAFRQCLDEDKKTNRVQDSLQLWRDIVSSMLLAKTAFILLFNKAPAAHGSQRDILEAHIAAGVMVKKYVPSFGDRPNDVPTVKKCMQLTLHRSSLTYCIADFRDKFSAYHMRTFFHLYTVY